MTTTEIEGICEQLEGRIPCSTLTAAIHWFTIGEPTVGTEIDYWATSFTFLLIVLAANGVPYEC